MGSNRNSAIALMMPKKSLQPGTSTWLSYLAANGYTTPSVNTINAVNQFIIDMGSDWALLDNIAFLGQDNRANSLVYIKNPSAPKITEQANGGIMGWAGYEGFFGDGSNSYLDSGFNPSTMGVNYTLNSSCIFTYSSQENGDGLYELYGAYDGANFIQNIPHWSPNGQAYILNNSTNNIIAGHSNSNGFYSAVRTSSSNLKMYENGTQTDSQTNTSVAVPNINIYIGAMNLNGTAARFFSHPISVFGFGSGAINQANLYAAIKKLLDNIYGNFAAKPIINPFISDNWAQIGGASTFAFSPNKIAISGGANDFLNNINYNKYFNDLDDFTISADIKITQLGVAGTGIGFNVYLLNSGQMALGKINPNTGLIDFIENSSVISSLPSIGGINLNDVIRVTLRKNANELTTTAKNLTTNSPTVSYIGSDTMSYPFASTATSCSNRFSIFNVSGSCEVQNFNVMTTQIRGGSLFVGDSKTWGSGAGSPSARYQSNGTTSLLRQTNAGPGDTSAEVISRLNEIIAYKPTNVILWIGCNDIRNGLSVSTVISNITTIKNTLVAAGINVYILTSAPENAINVAPLNAQINSTFTNVIDIYPALWSGSGTSLNASFNCGDGTHLNAAGYTVIYNIIKTAYPSII